jgi:hypothetical protein
VTKQMYCCRNSPNDCCRLSLYWPSPQINVSDSQLSVVQFSKLALAVHLVSPLLTPRSFKHNIQGDASFCIYM